MSLKISPQWVSVEERMPPIFTEVLVAIKGVGTAKVAWLDVEGKWDDEGAWVCEEIVTHWMELPELPEG